VTSGGARLRATTLGAALIGGALAILVALGGCAAGPATQAGGDPAHHRPQHSGRPTPDGTPHPTPPPRPTPSTPPTPAGVGFDATAKSVDDPASTWVVVNKSRALQPISYAPADLVYPDVAYVNRQPMRAEVADALVAMFRAGKQEAGLDFSVETAYRSFDSQTRVYDDDFARNGQAFADTDTARPGHSEHQTGLAVDISAVPAACSLDACFGDTPQGKWLAANAWRFGFLLRYPADKVDVTGYPHEAWHYRYIGETAAADMHDRGILTLEEYAGLPAAPDYG